MEFLDWLCAGTDLHWSCVDISQPLQADALLHRQGGGDLPVCRKNSLLLCVTPSVHAMCVLHSFVCFGILSALEGHEKQVEGSRLNYVASYSWL